MGKTRSHKLIALILSVAMVLSVFAVFPLGAAADGNKINDPYSPSDQNWQLEPVNELQEGGAEAKTAMSQAYDKYATDNYKQLAEVSTVTAKTYYNAIVASIENRVNLTLSTADYNWAAGQIKTAAEQLYDISALYNAINEYSAVLGYKNSNVDSAKAALYTKKSV